MEPSQPTVPAADSAEPFRLAVFNPDGNDPDQDFPDRAGEVDPAVHAPINYHAYAACTGGAFCRSWKAVEQSSSKSVLLLLQRDLSASLKAMRHLKKLGRTVAISFKESGTHQVARQLANPGDIAVLYEICALTDGIISSTQDMVAFYQAASGGRTKVEFIPTPYPLDDPRWDFSIPIGGRRGILIGTREFDISSRNHLAAVIVARGLARDLNERISVINCDGRSGERMLESVGFQGGKLKVIAGPLPYPNYLKEIAKHKLVFQLDKSSVPGQIAGDALLCRLPCVGGDGAIERLVYPELTGHGKAISRLVGLIELLTKNETYYAETVAASQHKALGSISFAAVAKRLELFFKQLSTPPVLGATSPAEGLSLPAN